MKILADESIEKPIVTKLRAEGHQVTYIAEIAPGSTDPEVLAFANDEASYPPSGTMILRWRSDR